MNKPRSFYVIEDSFILVFDQTCCCISQAACCLLSQNQPLPTASTTSDVALCQLNTNIYSLK